MKIFSVLILLVALVVGIPLTILSFAARFAVLSVILGWKTADLCCDCVAHLGKN